MAVQLQSSLEASASAHKSLSAMLDSAKQVRSLAEAMPNELASIINQLQRVLQSKRQDVLDGIRLPPLRQMLWWFGAPILYIVVHLF